MVIKIAEEAYVRAGLARGNECASGTVRGTNALAVFTRARLVDTEKFGV